MKTYICPKCRKKLIGKCSFSTHLHAEHKMSVGVSDVSCKQYEVKGSTGPKPMRKI